MSFILSLLDAFPFIIWPTTWYGWFGALLWFGVLGGLGWRFRHYNKMQIGQDLLWLFGLVFVQLLATAFIGIRLSPGNALTIPGYLSLPVGPAIMLLAAVPWIVGAGVFGPIAGMVLAGFSGFLLAFFDTHLIFTVFEYALFGLLMGGALNQRYRTRLFRALAHPAVTGFLLLLFYPILFVIGMMLSLNAAPAVMLDIAFSRVITAWQAVMSSVVLGGLLAEIPAQFLTNRWGEDEELQPSPLETSIETRTMYLMIPIVVLISLVLAMLGWSISNRIAREQLQNQLRATTEMGADSIPYGLEVGQNLIQQLAQDPRVFTDDLGQLAEFLEQQQRLSSYFRHFMVFDESGTMLVNAPQVDLVESQLSSEEELGLVLAQQGVTFQYYAIQPTLNGEAARLSFMATIAAPNTTRVLVGRTDLAQNPFTAPIIRSLQGIRDAGGEGYLVDQDLQVLYHVDPFLILTTPYNGEWFNEPTFYDATGTDGTRSLIYFQPVVGRAWAIITSVPAQQVQQLALSIAAPLLALLLLLLTLLVVLLRVVLRFVTGSLRRLSVEANRIATQPEGLATPLQVGGEDEIGQMRASFEKMRSSLSSRMEEQDQLLLVTRGVASSLDIRKAVDPILDAGLSFGASAARIVLNDAMIPELGSEPRSTFWKGDSASKYYHLDRPLLDMNKSQELVVLTNPARARMLNLENTVAPESLIASAIRSENQFYGTLWLAFENPHAFSDEEQRFVTTIASQAALAAENARLFLTAEVEQQRLSAVLASTPDAVLVTDQSGRVLVMNPMAAQLLLSSSQTASRGKLISDVIRQREILDLLSSEQQSVQTREITLTNGKTYMASATPVIADETVLGRVCVLRDVTYLKELDEIKSEFVATVSHDLRSPLTLMRGYATMLDMVGDLNDQQKGYISKIITGVENMSKLVSNLLDLGRIEAGVGLNLEMVPIVDVIKQVKDQLQLQATQKQIELAASYPPQAMPLVEGDPALLRQAIQNLIENAIKYTNSEGRVNVKLVVNPHSDSVLFTVQDTGIGIAPVDQPRLFERFFRAAKRETRSQTGTGLGLAIVKSIAERHNGRVWVKSQLGKGSEFYLEIPLRQPIGVRT